MSDRDPAHLHPALKTIYMQWLPKCYGAGIMVKPIVTWRDAADQDKAEAEGKSRASFGQSPHNHTLPDGTPAALAFDFGVFECDDEGDEKYITDGTDPRYRQAGEIGVALGLVYGGYWTYEEDGCGPDWDHLEMANWKTLS